MENLGIDIWNLAGIVVNLFLLVAVILVQIGVNRKIKEFGTIPEIVAAQEKIAQERVEKAKQDAQIEKIDKEAKNLESGFRD